MFVITEGGTIQLRAEQGLPNSFVLNLCPGKAESFCSYCLEAAERLHLAEELRMKNIRVFLK